jgi:excisionase family DNA binding protein
MGRTTGQDSNVQPALRVGEVARLLDVTVTTIHHWQANFPMTVYRQGGQRRFPQKTINRLRLIRQLTYREGRSLHDARKRYEELLSFNW